MKRLFKLGLMTIVSLIIGSCAQDDSTRDLAVSELAVATEVNQFSEVESLQRSALAALYESTGGANWLRNDNWNTNAPLSEWYGLKVEDGYVTSIDLSDNNLTGTLPGELVQLGKIQSIILSGNKIGGQIPAAWGVGASTRSDAGYDDEESYEEGVDEDFGDSDADYDLDAILAQLSAIADDGEVEIEDITPFISSLAVLDLSDNLITGTLPEELGNLNKLRSLSIKGNLMKGEISMALQQSAMWQSLSEVPLLEQKQNNVLTIASSSDGKATAVRLDKTSLTLPVGKKYTFTPTITPSNANVKAIKWKTGDKTIVAINTSGTIKGVKAGTANIGVYVYNQDGTYVAAKCRVTVTEDVPATAVRLNTSEVTLDVGEKYTFTSTITPANATPTKVVWKTGNESIVRVGTGAIRGLKPGTANVGVYVYNADGSVVVAKCKVTVKEPNVPATAVKLNTREISLNVGEKYTFTSTITPANATPTKVVWKSGNTSIVRVGTGAIRGLKAGTANVGVYVYNEDGSVVVAKCKVTVKEPNVPATAVKLNTTATTLEVGKRLRLTPTITPTNATPSKVVWKSGNSSVVEVSDGVIKGIGAGTANVGVYVYNEDGSVVTAKCKVTVKVPVVRVTDVSLNTSSMRMEAGTTEQLTATVNPSTAANKAVNWTSSDSSVATVDSNGKVTALKAGESTITVTTADGGKTATCKVTVVAKNTTGNAEDFNEVIIGW